MNRAAAGAAEAAAAAAAGAAAGGVDTGWCSDRSGRIAERIGPPTIIAATATTTAGGSGHATATTAGSGFWNHSTGSANAGRR